MDNNRAEKDTRPNIILILADDMGFSDIGCFGSEINTPNIDSIASDGAVFTQAYNCARCCPSRASILTGLQPHQAGIGYMVGDLGQPAYQGYLNNNCVTIAEALKMAGYNTALSGKWHTGGHYDLKLPESSLPIGDDKHPTPTQRGFDRFYGILIGGASYYNPKVLMKNDTLVRPEGDDYYYTDAITDHAIDTIDDFVKKDEPFFLHLSFTAPHWPLHAFEEDINKYVGKYRAGWDITRQNRHENLKGLKILDPKWEISPRDEEAMPWEEVENKIWEDRRMAVYAAQVERMDYDIGRVIDRLKQLNILDNTLIIFLSDNGGCAEFLAEDSNLPIFDQFNFPTRDGRLLKIGNTPEIFPGAEDTFASYDLPWANASNTPFKLYKHWVHEGGISTPLIINWKDRIKYRKIIHSPVHVIDLMATCLDAAGCPYPSEYNGNNITPLEGESLLPAYSKAGWSRQRPLCWEHEGNRAVRDGRWKLVSKYPGDWELYDMIEDRTEILDLVSKNMPEVAKLKKYYEDWAARCGVLQWPVGSGSDIDYIEMLRYKKPSGR
jgi:arylsulfatase